MCPFNDCSLRIRVGCQATYVDRILFHWTNAVLSRWAMIMWRMNLVYTLSPSQRHYGVH